jgi:hypothetical protein
MNPSAMSTMIIVHVLMSLLAGYLTFTSLTFVNQPLLTLLAFLNELFLDFADTG